LRRCGSYIGVVQILEGLGLDGASYVAVFVDAVFGLWSYRLLAVSHDPHPCELQIRV
jgi:hypothetical protein